MAKNRGDVAFFEVSDDGGSTWNKLGNRNTLTVDINRDEIEVTDADSQGWREYLASYKDATIDVEGFINSDDTGQGLLLDHVLNDTDIRARWGYVEGSGEDQYEAPVFHTSSTKDNPIDDAGSFSFSLRVKEKPTVTQQA